MSEIGLPLIVGMFAGLLAAIFARLGEVKAECVQTNRWLSAIYDEERRK